MKLKRVFAVLFSIVVLSGCKAGEIEKKDPKIKSDIPIVSESSDKLVKDNIPVSLPDLDTEKGVKEYFVGEWVYDEEYGTDVVCKMNIDKNLKEWNHDCDHIHLLFKGHPNTEISKFLNAYKSASSRLIKKEFPEIREQLWKEYFWNRSYCLLTTGGATIDVVRKYIENQKEK